MVKTFYAWAIDTKSDEGHGLIGRYYFSYCYLIPKNLEGCITSLFPTRKVARQHLPRVKQPYAFPKARVVKVRVTIEEVSNG